MFKGKKQKIYLSVAAGIMTLFLVAVVFATGGSDFFAKIVKVNGAAVTGVTVSAVNIIDDEHNGTTPVTAIEVNNGTIRMVATVTPGDASNAEARRTPGYSRSLAN